MKKTTWYFYDKWFKEFLRTNAQQKKITVAILSDLRRGVKLFGRLIQSEYIYYSAVHWILLRGIDDIQAERQAYENISPPVRLFIRTSSALSALTDGEIDLIVAKTNLEGTSVTLMSYADVNVDYDTFYARANDTRTKSVFQVFACSAAGVYLTVTCMAACALALAFLGGIHSLRKFIVNFAREALFLLAVLLATSSPESQFQRHRRIRQLLYLLWYLCILSMSAYIRSEMTAMVTVTGPADHLDTLEELESALDRRTVAPCVLKGSSTQSILESTAENTPNTLMRKLAAAYRSQKRKGLVAETPLECLLRAGRRDRVCYSPLQPRCIVEDVARGVRAFPEPFTMVLEGFPVRHGCSFLPALRKFFFAVREASPEQQD
ncbi:hypothetical protein MTO96_040953 [Rhipicephalus appendiculatus]